MVQFRRFCQIDPKWPDQHPEFILSLHNILWSLRSFTRVSWYLTSTDILCKPQFCSFLPSFICCYLFTKWNICFLYFSLLVSNSSLSFSFSVFYLPFVCLSPLSFFLYLLLSVSLSVSFFVCLLLFLACLLSFSDFICISCTFSFSFCLFLCLTSTFFPPCLVLYFS